MTRTHASPTFALLALFALLAATPALAGGPLVNCRSGVPFLWPNGGQNIVWNPDQGNLGPLTNPQAVALVAASFQVWEDVPSATISFVQGPPLATDIDITNFGPIFNPPAPNGLSEIVFDADGSIFNLLFGPGSGILGFAGPDFGNTLSCEILEGSAFLNGPEFGNLTAAKDIMVHEFGHFSNTAHTVVNGQAVGFGDTTGPTGDNSFGTPAVTQIETMYPFYFGPGSGTQTLERDDIAILSTLYPEPDFFSTTGTIAGTIFESNGITRVSGVNVIARNLADPFNDAVSAISGDFTDSLSQVDPVVGTYALNGLTPGAQYVVFIDRILAGGFSTPPFAVDQEEYWNGVRESGDGTADDPLDREPIVAAAGAPATGIDILFNGAGPGCLDLRDDDFEELPLPFEYTLCDQTFTTVFVNSNGNLTFGVGDTDFSETEAEFLASPPRIAGLWDDLNPSRGGMICFDQTSNTFTVTYTDVPEFLNTGANTFSITLKKGADQAEISWGDITATDGLAGVSCGGLNNGLEPETVLVTVPNSRTINLHSLTAVYERFTGDNDLDGYNIKFANQDKPFEDPFEPNDNLGDATPQVLPFTTRNDFTAILPVGDDVDYFEVSAVGGTSLVCEVTAGSLDSVLGIFDAGNGNLLATDDDGGAGLLSRIVFPVPADGTFGIAVSTFPDLDFNGNGNTGGRYVLECFAINGVLLDLSDDDTENVPIAFSFPFQGSSYSSVNVNSNGNLTFGGGDTDFSESVSEFLNELPRIAPLWDDLNPSSAGLVIVESDASSWRVTFDGVPEFASSTTNTFSVTLEPDGTITIAYGNVAANDGIVGVTEGGGAADPGETNLSAGGPFSANGTTYERFTSTDTFDLDNTTLVFEP